MLRAFKFSVRSCLNPPRAFCQVATCCTSFQRQERTYLQHRLQQNYQLLSLSYVKKKKRVWFHQTATEVYACAVWIC